MVSQLDRHVGEIGQMLKELGLDENTIIFFTSDNGPHKEGGYNPEVFNSNGNLKGIKRDLYEGGIRVPLIVKWPGKVKAGSESNYTWANWDFLPTVAEVIGIKAPQGIDGISALPAIKGKNVERSAPLYWEFITPANSFRMAVRQGKWKGVVYNTDEGMQLYDLDVDPSEKNNLAKLYPEKVSELKKVIQQTRTPSKYWPVDEDKLKVFYQ
jgi:arylsulfatase A-like enzyme